MADSPGTDPDQVRARDLGIDLPGMPGQHNAITDVPGVTVGYTTLISGDGPLVVGQGPVRTGVTAILPRALADLDTPCAAGSYALNGNGEMTGTAWIAESGAMSTPITISNTHAIGACHSGVISWITERRPEMGGQWLLPVCAETWDGYLNDINGAHVRPEHVVAALDAARSAAVAEGSVGGGTGMSCYGFKGGNGTASRVVPWGSEQYTVAAFVQANFGARPELMVAGVPIGRLLAADDSDEQPGEDIAPPGAGSVIVVLATDAPLLPAQCTALARRAPLGLARTGTTGSHFSGDFALAFSTANAGSLRSDFAGSDASAPVELDTIRFTPWGRIDPFYAAAVYSVEEAVLNALVVNQDMTGRDGHRRPALPHEALRQLLAGRRDR